MAFDCECITHLCEKHGGPDVARGLIADYEARIHELKAQLNKCRWELEQARGGISRDNIHKI